MKKILLMLMLIGICFNSYAQIIGSPVLTVGEQSSYFIIPPDLNNRVSWSCRGGIQLTSSSFTTATVKAVSPGVGILDVSIYNSNGSRIWYEMMIIDILPNPKAPKIEGVSTVISGKTYTYKFASVTGFSLTGIWTFDKEYFELVSQTLTEITLKVKDKKGITAISQPVNEIYTGIVMLSSKTITVTDAVFEIKPSKSAVYNDEQISYTIDGCESGDIITWQDGNNMILVSGQGTTTATFKASGILFDAYGYAASTVKAIISHNGKNYSIKNSDVQIKLKPSTGSITYNAINSTIDISSKDLVGSLEFGKDIKGATKFQWGGAFPPQYTDGKTNSVYAVAKKHIIQAKGMSIYVDASNSSETVRIFYNVTVDGKGGFLID